MYTITRCPSCHARFEIDRSHIGLEAECLECARPFALWDAAAPGARPKPSGDDATDPVLVLDRPFGFAEILGVTFGTVFSKNWGGLVVTGLLLGLLSAFAAAVVWVAAFAAARFLGPAAVLLPSAASFVAQLLIVFPLTWGAWWVCANAARGQGADAERLFAGYRRVGAVAAVGALWTMLGLAVALGVGAAAAPGLLLIGASRNAGPGLVVGAILLLAGVAAGLAGAAFIGVRLFFAPLVLLDERRGRVGPIEAYAESWRLMRGKVASSAAAVLVVGLVAAASIPIVCLGPLLIGVPLTLAVYGSIYALAVSEDALAAGGQRPPTPHGLDDAP